MSESDRVTVTLRLKDAARFYAEAKKAEQGIKGIGDAAEKADRKSKGFGGSLNLVGRTMRLLKPAGLVVGLGLLTQVLSASAAGAIGLVAALAPLAGAVAALPAGIAVAAQGLGVLKLGFAGVKDAIGGLNSNIDPKKFFELSQPAQSFVIALQGMKKPIRDLQSSVQAGMLPGVQKGLEAMLPAVGKLKGPLTQTGRVIGGFADRLGHLVGSKSFLKDLADQANFNNVQLRRMGGAGLHVVNILRNLMVGARPLVSWLVRLAAGWAASGDKAVAAARKNGKLREFFHSVQVTISRVVRIGADLAATFWNIGKAGKKNLGDSLLVSLVRGADALHKWSSSSKGIRQITKYFRDAKPVVYAVGRLFKALGVEFLGMGAGGPGMAALIDHLTALVPTLGDFVKSTTKAMGPVMIDMISAFAQAFAPLAGSSGPLVLFAKALTKLAQAAGWIMKNVPGATPVLTTFFGALAVVKTIGLMSFTSDLFGMGRGMDSVGKAGGKARRAIDAFSKSTLGTRIGVALLDGLDLLKRKFLGVRDAAGEAAAAEDAATGGGGKGGRLSRLLRGAAKYSGPLAAAAALGYGVDHLFPHGGALDRHKDKHGNVTPGGRRSQVTRGDSNPYGSTISRHAPTAGRFLGGLAQVIANAIAGRRALGGPVNAGSTYLVGEHGPELFSPSGGGHITANSMLMRGPDLNGGSGYGLRAPTQRTATVDAAKSQPGTPDLPPIIVENRIKAQLVLEDGTVLANLVDDAVGRSMARE